MNTTNSKGERKKRIGIKAAIVLLLLLQLAVLFYYGSRKAGFHEDEFYSYYSTNKTAGLFVNDRQWQEQDSYRNDFVVLPGERFRYGVVAQMQSWDVHPPLYYFILHTVCSLFPGVFSKWLGIAVNVIAFIPCFLLLWYLVNTTMRLKKSGNETIGWDETKQDRKMAVFFSFAVCLFWGFGAAVISGVMFIRMYQWLTLFILLCACLHVRAIQRKDFGLRFLAPLGITVYLGFLTQYYYIIFHIFMGAGFCFLLLKNRKIKELFTYALACAAGLGAAIFSYPASMAHIFRGYRGTEAVSEFGNAGNTAGRLRFFIGLFDDYVMNRTLSIWLLAICIVWLTVVYRKKRKAVLLKTEENAVKEGQKIKKTQEKWGREQAVGLLLFTCMGYFFTISKTALLLGETSNRYQLPVYGILIFLLLYFLLTPVIRLAEEGQKKENIFAAAGIIVIAVLLATDVAALLGNRVFFLYEEENAVMDYVKENKDIPVVVFYNEASPDNVWRLSDELMEFPGIYLAAQGNEELITDKIITESDSLLVYVADHDDKEKCLENLLTGSKKLSGYEIVAEKGLWTLYRLE